MSKKWQIGSIKCFVPDHLAELTWNVYTKCKFYCFTVEKKPKKQKLFNIEKPFFIMSIARPTTSLFPSCWLLDHFTVLGIFILVQAALGPDIHSVPLRQHHWYNDLLIKILVYGKQGKCGSRKPCSSGSDWPECILGSVLKHQCHKPWDMEECACSVQGPGICILYKCQGTAHVGGPWTP